jgi:5S rRNA maturation endonuclease (ribonuclease M5)
MFLMRSGSRSATCARSTTTSTRRASFSSRSFASRVSSSGSDVPTATTGVWSLDRTRRVLYRLPRLLEAVAAGETVYVCEGEKDVHILEDAGVVATCNPHGAGKWRDEYSKTLTGANVVVVQDRDKPGRQHARQVANSLTKTARTVTVVEAAEGKDAHDHLKAGFTINDFVPVPLDEAKTRTNGREAARSPLAPIELARLLERLVAYFRRYVVATAVQADAVALWTAHTHVFETSCATPYLHFTSPEPGSGKTTALEVLEPVAREGLIADDLTGPSLFRLIDERRPTLLYDEVDGVFGKKNNDGTEDIRKVLNSGYRAGKRVFRCVPPTNELREFNVYCPKALASINDLPGTLAHRSIPIQLKPPLPDDEYSEFDLEDVEDETAALSAQLAAWAEAAKADLRDPRLKPAKLPQLDARRNQIWRILFRIADLAGGRWPEASRKAAIELSAGARRLDEGSPGIRLLADVKAVFAGERMSCADLAAALNTLETSPWGDMGRGDGLTTRQLGRRLKPYGILAKPIRIDGARAGNGYEFERFEDAFARYLPHPSLETGTPVQPAWIKGLRRIQNQCGTSLYR